MIPHRAFVHLREARGVPKLGAEIAIAFDALFAELDVASLRRHRRQRKAQRVGARICRSSPADPSRCPSTSTSSARRVAHQGVDVDFVERHFLHEVQPIIIIRATQKKMMSCAVTSDGVGVEALQLRRSSPANPAWRTGQSADENHVSSTSSSLTQLRRPCRNACAPRLARRSRFLRRRLCRPAHTKPECDGPTRAGARCTTARCCASIGNRSSSNCSGTNLVVPLSTAAIARFASSPALTYHWSVSIGSMTTFGAIAERLALIFLSSTDPAGPALRCRPRLALRASKRSRPRYFAGTCVGVAPCGAFVVHQHVERQMCARRATW